MRHRQARIDVRLTFAVAGALIVSIAAGAVAASGQERLIQLDQIAISHDLCGFTLSSAQEQTLANESDAAADENNMQPEDAQRLYDQFAESMRRQKATGLCDPKETWAAEYAKLAATLGP